MAIKKRLYYHRRVVPHMLNLIIQMEDADELGKQPAGDETPDIFINNLATERGNAGHSSAKLQEG
ncbi:MAG: hypothetical protein ACYDAW_02485 [Acidithiobacillus ferrivorans]